MSYEMQAAVQNALNTKYGGWVHGLGIDASTGRTILRPNVNARRIHMDGLTAGPDANLNYSAATVAAAKALVRAGSGDWILFPAGGSNAGAYGTMVGSAGLSAQYPHVIGTYDPTDKLNVAKYNTGTQYLWNVAGLGLYGTGAYIFQGFSTGGDVAIVNQQTAINYTDESQIGIYFLGIASRVLIERCILNNTPTLINSGNVSAASQLGRLDSALSTDVTFNQCGFAYGGALFNNGGVNVYIQGTRRLKFKQCVFYHGGWGPNVTRASIGWGYTTTPVSTITSVGTTATANIANTSTMANGGNVYIVGASPAAYNGYYTITSLTANTSITYTFAGNGGVAATGASITAGNPNQNGWTLATGDGTNIYNHGVYINEENDTIEITDCVTAWDDVNDKWTGGGYTVRNHVHIRCPMAMITDPNGNDGANLTWPAGAHVGIFNHLQVNAADMNTAGTGARGLGPSLYGLDNTSEYTNGLLLNQDNPQTGNRAGVVGNANSRAIATYLNVNHSIVANWGANNATVEANTTKTWRYNVTDDATALPGGTSILRSTANATAQAAITAALALNVHTTFRNATPELAGVTVNADPLVTEQNVCAFMYQNPQINWAVRLQQHFRQAVGR